MRNCRDDSPPDAEVIGRADADSRVVVTKDADFVNSFQLTGQPAGLEPTGVAFTGLRA